MYLRDAFPSLRAALSLKTVGYGAFFAAALVFAGLVSGAIHRSFHAWPGDGLLKAVGVALVVAGLTLRPGALVTRYREAHLSWASSMEPALAQAKTAGKPAIVDFFAEWCAACKELDRYVYTEPEFAQEAERYAIDGLPTILFIDSTGKVREDLTLKGFVEAPTFVARMKEVR